MGWDGCDAWKKKSDVVAESLRPGRFEGLVVIAHKSTRSGLWMVMENPSTGLRAIFFDLIEKQNGRYYVKDMAESECPYYYDVPKDFLDMVPEEKAFMFNSRWRATVRAEWARDLLRKEGFEAFL